MHDVFDQIVELVIGITGTVSYLYFWNRTLSSSPPISTDRHSPQNLALRRRRRFYQIIFFLGMTPYVLLLYYAMDHVKSVVRTEEALPIHEFDILDN